jgi:lipopolysaccharide export system permease protein
MKYSIAAVCFIFMFIGAPMGAIVRKGGFGYPLLVAIVFFMLFVILTIFCRKIAETFVVSAYLAAWIPCIILMPLGMWLTYKAMNDQPLNLFEGLRYFFQNLLKRFRNAKTVQG